MTEPRPPLTASNAQAREARHSCTSGEHPTILKA
eukprot:CAMPEP_0171242064 /NCGR_PEP_ID=MMETSP0790-20130122/45461_1 /TAXON_ID=2925 /ORGANISM="Alexandrium catenella, Strain OF101" /LENGTH=33 /DNA_ID= /DNA_START= /DNA_END= /DNA_ORIENTATION=